MNLADAADIAQVVIAASVALFTWRLFELERRRARREVRPILGLSPTGIPNPAVKNTAFFSSEMLEIRNFGDAPALGCRIDWRPADVNVMTGLRSLYEMDYPAGSFSLAAGEAHTTGLRINRERALRQEAGLAPVMVPNPQFGPQRVGSEMPIGEVRVTYQTIVGEDQRASFTIKGRYTNETGELEVICSAPQVG